MPLDLASLAKPSRETLERYLPVLFAIAVAWLFARGLKKLFWTAFGMYWALHASGLVHHG